MLVPRKLDRSVAIAHMSAVRDDDEANEIAMFGTPGVELPESFDATVGLSPDIAAGLRDVFRISPGMQCGKFFIHDPFLMSAEAGIFTDSTDGGQARWQDMAVFNDDLPIFVERSDGTIWRPGTDSFRGMGREPMLKVAPDVLTFAAWTVMGPGYLDFAIGDDDWADFLRSRNFYNLRLSQDVVP